MISPGSNDVGEDISGCSIGSEVAANKLQVIAACICIHISCLMHHNLGLGEDLLS